MRPIIGLTLDSEPPGAFQDGRRSAASWYTLRENYTDAVSRAGGIPVCLPHIPELAEAYVERLDALIVTGGAFDVDPARFGARETHPSVRTKAKRTEFEWRLTEAALARDLPLLGVCGGEQLLNVVLGGSLIQHIPDEVPNALEHEQRSPRHEPAHEVYFCEETKLCTLLGERILVNSTHHQAVAGLGRELRVAGRAPDGVIEAIEHTRLRFTIGVQWHPEYFVPGHGLTLLSALVECAARKV